MANLDIREAIEKKRIKYWEVAHELGVDASTLCRWLRTEATGERKEAILAAIERIK